MPPIRCSAAPTAGHSSPAWWAHCSEGREQRHPCLRCGTRTDRRGVRARGLDPRSYPEPDRARHIRGDVERALLVQIIEDLAQNITDYRATRDLRSGRERWGG